MMDSTDYKFRTANDTWMISSASFVHAAAEHGDNVTTRHPDGSIEIVHALGGGKAMLYVPVTDAQAQQIRDANRERGRKVRPLVALVRKALRAAEDVPDGKHMLELGVGMRSGVVASVFGGAVLVNYWHMTYLSELFAGRQDQDPWADGGVRDATRAALEAFAAEHGCTVTEGEKRDRFLVTPA
ncbi:hypothetical protein ABTX81_30425 [Kitasatospora sp. NPDC097605]|uniref:hypothetical protein n=1 Tax=Kitasatospora sp. NPDC097605 TaxID=3157226 RepID=UPI003327A6A5